LFHVATEETTAAPSEETTAVPPGKTTNNMEKEKRQHLLVMSTAERFLIKDNHHTPD